MQHEVVGVEDLTINCTNSATTIPILWNCTYGSWIKGVKVRYALGYNLYGQWSLFSEVRECYIDSRRGSGSNGSGIIFDAVAGFLIEDNIVYRQMPHIELNFGSSGGVVGYNYCFDSTDYGVSGQAGPSLDINHGPHNTSILSEGNIANNYISDGYYGGESRNNAYRNWFRGTQPSTPGLFAVNLKRFSRQGSLIANVFGEGPGNSTLYTGQPNIGNFTSSGFAPVWADWGNWIGPTGFQELDTNVVRSTYLKLNYYTGTNGVPVAQQTGDTLVDSLYLSGTPSWFGILDFPAIGPDVSQAWTSTATIPNTAIIPAQARYYGLNYTTPPTPPSTNNSGGITGSVKLRGGVNLRSATP